MSESARQQYSRKGYFEAVSEIMNMDGDKVFRPLESERSLRKGSREMLYYNRIVEYAKDLLGDVTDKEHSKYEHKFEEASEEYNIVYEITRFVYDVRDNLKPLVEANDNREYWDKCDLFRENISISLNKKIALASWFSMRYIVENSEDLIENFRSVHNSVRDSNLKVDNFSSTLNTVNTQVTDLRRELSDFRVHEANNIREVLTSSFIKGQEEFLKSIKTWKSFTIGVGGVASLVWGLLPVLHLCKVLEVSPSLIYTLIPISLLLGVFFVFSIKNWRNYLHLYAQYEHKINVTETINSFIKASDSSSRSLYLEKLLDAAVSFHSGFSSDNNEMPTTPSTELIKELLAAIKVTK